jgi:uncharacterized protein YhfF
VKKTHIINFHQVQKAEHAQSSGSGIRTVKSFQRIYTTVLISEEGDKNSLTVNNVVVSSNYSVSTAPRFGKWQKSVEIY